MSDKRADEKLKAMALIDVWVVIDEVKHGFSLNSDERIMLDVWQTTWRTEYLKSRELLRVPLKRPKVLPGLLLNKKESL